MNRNEAEQAPTAELGNRRQFLRNALWFGGAALLLTSTSRETLANSATLNQQEMDAVRRAQQAKGTPADSRHAKATQVASAYNGCDCSGCSGCTSSCEGCNGCSGCSGSSK